MKSHCFDGTRHDFLDPFYNKIPNFFAYFTAQEAADHHHPPVR